LSAENGETSTIDWINIRRTYCYRITDTIIKGLPPADYALKVIVENEIKECK